MMNLEPDRRWHITEVLHTFYATPTKAKFSTADVGCESKMGSEVGNGNRASTELLRSLVPERRNQLNYKEKFKWLSVF